MVETTEGLLVAYADPSRCTGCGLCLKSCPATHLESQLVPSGADPFKGVAAGAYCGQAADKRLVGHGQSGGVVTALLYDLLDRRRIERALVTQMPEDGSLRPRCLLTSDREDLYRAQGSKYCPAALNAALPGDLTDAGSRMAMVGLPCHVHGLRNLQRRMEQNEHTGITVIGLVCANVLSYLAMTSLIRTAGEDERDVVSFRYKDKSLRGWPGDVCLRTRRGGVKYLSSRCRYAVWEAFTPIACRLCFDKLNILADIVVGDPWNIKQDDREGHSVVLARTQRGKDLILGAQNRGAVRLETIDPERFFAAHRIERRRSGWTANVRQWETMGGTVPDFGIEPRWHGELNESGMRCAAENLGFAQRLSRMDSQTNILRAVRRRVRRKRLADALNPRVFLHRVQQRLRKP